MPSVIPNDVCDQVVEAYTTPRKDGTWIGANTIASQFGIAPQTVHNILKRCGISTRSSKEAYANGRRTKPIKNVPTTIAPMCRCGCYQPTKWNRRKNCWNIYIEGHDTPDKPYHHYDWLYDQYIDQQKTFAEIASMFAVTSGTIARSAKRLGVPARNRSESRIGRKSGERNPAWKGGVTPERQRLYKTQEWSKSVSAAFKRDHFTCQRCGAGKEEKGSLHAHHIKRFALHPELRFALSNLITLCKKCHLWVHSKENVNRDYLK